LYRYPPDAAAQDATGIVRSADSAVRRVLVVCVNDTSRGIFDDLL
jgi:hypothetical protein